MKKVAGILGVGLAGASLLAWFASSAAGASLEGPRRGLGRDRRQPQAYSVAEPASIVLLGAGLVVLGIYAKKKNAKKN